MRTKTLSLVTTFVLLSCQCAWGQDPSATPSAKPKAKRKEPTKVTQSARTVKVENATIAAFKPFEVGDQTTCTRVYRNEIKMTVTVRGQPGHLVGNTLRLKVKKRWTVTGTKDGKVNEMELKFLNRKETVVKQDPTRRNKPSADEKDPYAGKTYVLSFNGKKVTAKEKNPQQAGDADKAKYYRVVLGMGELTTFKKLEGGFAKNVPAGELKVGETFVFPEAAAVDLMNADMLANLVIERRQLIYKGTAISGKIKCAVFEVVLIGTPKNAASYGGMSTMYKGRIYVDLKTKRTLELTFKGSLEMNTEDPNRQNGGPKNPNPPDLEIDGSGSMEGTVFYTHSKKGKN